MGGCGNRSPSQGRNHGAQQSLDFDSTYVDGALHGDGLRRLQYRKAKGDDTEQTEMPDAHGANVIQLERRGNTFILSAAKFGEPFQVTQQENVDLPEEPSSGCSSPRTTWT